MAELNEKSIEELLSQITEQLKRIADSVEKQKILELMRLFPNDQDLGEKVREYYTRLK